MPTPAPLGEPLPNWTPPPPPPRRPLPGTHCTVEPIDISKHSADLHQANQQDRQGNIWTYLPYGPFPTLTEYQNWLAATCLSDDPMFYAIIDHKTQKAAGVASYLRITPAAGSIETGHINYSPLMQQTTIATEAMYLMMKNIFTLGYRRYEWKCNALNQRSRTAATRLGFTYEGTFRQMLVVKARNRDTAWFSIIDKEWQALNQAYKIWLAADNFTPTGTQRQSLSTLTTAALAA